MSVFDDYRRRTWEPGADISEQQTELATSLRVPFLTSAQPRWTYIAGIVVSDEMYFEKGIVPTEVEVRVVASFIEEYCERWYNDAFHQAMAELAPYDIDGAANLAYLIKQPDGDWCYRKRTWTHGAYWSGPHGKPAPLVDVLDWVYTIGSDKPMQHWTDWKSARPEVFEAAA